MANLNNSPERKNDSGALSSFKGITSLFDRYARDFFSSDKNNSRAFKPKVEVVELEKEYNVMAELPGIKEENIRLSLVDNVLVIEGEKRNERKSDKGGTYRSEFTYGAFHRSIPFEADVDDKNINATFQDGILKVNLIKKNDGIQEPIKIEINKGPYSSIH